MLVKLILFFSVHQYVVQVYIHNYHTQKEKEYIANIIIIGFGNELKTKYVFFFHLLSSFIYYLLFL